MSNARIRLYQYPSDSRCAAIQLILQQSELPFEVIPLHYCEPSPVVQLTKGMYAAVPVIEDILMSQVVFAEAPGKQNVARHIDNLAQMELFPEARRGLLQVLTAYIEGDCALHARKINDALYDRWVTHDLERGLLRRARELEFGPGCLEEWLAKSEQLQESWNDLLRPLNLMLGEDAFLLGPKVSFADYALFGVVREFLHSGGTHLSTEFVHLGNWLDKMTEGKFPRGKVGLEETTTEVVTSEGQEASNSLTDPSDLIEITQELKVTTGRQALVVECGHGHAAIALAQLGLNVTALDSDPANVDIARHQAEAADVRIKVLPMEGSTLPVESEKFDLVVSRMSSRLLPDAQAFLNEAGRVLKMYGYVVLIDIAGLDDHPEVTKWLNEVESLRGKHQRYIKPNDWRKWCQPLGLKLVKDQPGGFPITDLNWYLDIAHTSEENRQAILERFARAPAAVRELLKITMEMGTASCTLPHYTMVAGKI